MNNNLYMRTAALLFICLLGAAHAQTDYSSDADGPCADHHDSSTGSCAPCAARQYRDSGMLACACEASYTLTDNVCLADGETNDMHIMQTFDTLNSWFNYGNMMSPDGQWIVSYLEGTDEHRFLKFNGSQYVVHSTITNPGSQGDAAYSGAHVSTPTFSGNSLKVAFTKANPASNVHCIAIGSNSCQLYGKRSQSVVFTLVNDIWTYESHFETPPSQVLQQLNYDGTIGLVLNQYQTYLGVRNHLWSYDGTSWLQITNDPASDALPQQISGRGSFGRSNSYYSGGWEYTVVGGVLSQTNWIGGWSTAMDISESEDSSIQGPGRLVESSIRRYENDGSSWTSTTAGDGEAFKRGSMYSNGNDVAVVQWNPNSYWEAAVYLLVGNSLTRKYHITTDHTYVNGANAFSLSFGGDKILSCNPQHGECLVMSLMPNIPERYIINSAGALEECPENEYGYFRYECRPCTNGVRPAGQDTCQEVSFDNCPSGHNSWPSGTTCTDAACPTDLSALDNDALRDLYRASITCGAATECDEYDCGSATVNAGAQCSGSCDDATCCSNLPANSDYSKGYVNGELSPCPDGHNSWPGGVTCTSCPSFTQQEIHNAYSASNSC